MRVAPNRQLELVSKPAHLIFDEDGDSSHGEVFTRSWVVEMILDLVDYRAEIDLGERRIVEPSCGSGSFLVPIVERLSASCRRFGRDIAETQQAIRAYDIQLRNVVASQRKVIDYLVNDGVAAGIATQLAETWILHDDFLLGSHDQLSADYVVGNPPYVRLEDVDQHRRNAYVQACPTMGGRADLYVGFFEIGLSLLSDSGVLGFICADRWMRNSYGRKLREFVSSNFALETVVSMHEADAFESLVSAYPAVTVLRRAKQGSVVLAEANAAFDEVQALDLTQWHLNKKSRSRKTAAFSAGRVSRWFEGGASWPDGGPAELRLLADLENQLRPIQEEGIIAGIGVATGADGVFVTTDESIVEPERLLPMSMVQDVKSGEFVWSGHFLVDPWEQEGSLVDLSRYPRLEEYFASHLQQIRNRGVARKQPHNWYRTIDRVHHALIPKPKLLLPDMKMNMEPVLESGGFYPHHNLYYLVSDTWDIGVLGGVMISKFAEFFVRRYSVRMRGGTLRFQAQYLNRIRVPNRHSLSKSTQRDLARCFDERDRGSATELLAEVVGLSPSQRKLLL